MLQREQAYVQQPCWCNLSVIAAEDVWPDLDEADAMNLDWGFLQSLRDAGRAAAQSWLAGEEAQSDPRPSLSAQSASSPVRNVG